MNIFDLIIAVAAVSTAVGGYRLGFLGRVVSWLGLIAGFYIGLRLLPSIVPDLSQTTPSARMSIAVVILVAGAMIGLAVGLVAGSQLHATLPPGPIRMVDRVFGGVVGIAGALALLWLLIPAIASIPGWPARAVTNSSISRLLSRDLPTAPPAAQVLRRLVGGRDADVLDELQGGASGPPPRDIPLTPAVAQAVLASTVKVEGQACNEVIDGSGFTVAPDLVVTNAHVVAGEKPGNTSVLLPSGQTMAATVVMFDPNRDLALLSVPGLGERPLAVTSPQVDQVGAVFGHPYGQDQVAVSPARVSTVESAHVWNIYDTHDSTRDILILAAALAHGDSGGPLVNTSGQVVGVAFAIENGAPNTSYAINTSELRTALAEPRQAPASTQNCITAG